MGTSLDNDALSYEIWDELAWEVGDYHLNGMGSRFAEDGSVPRWVANRCFEDSLDALSRGQWRRAAGNANWFMASIYSKPECSAFIEGKPLFDLSEQIERDANGGIGDEEKYTLTYDMVNNMLDVARDSGYYDVDGYTMFLRNATDAMHRFERLYTVVNETKMDGESAQFKAMDKAVNEEVAASIMRGMESGVDGWHSPSSLRWNCSTESLRKGGLSDWVAERPGYMAYMADADAHPEFKPVWETAFEHRIGVGFHSFACFDEPHFNSICSEGFSGFSHAAEDTSERMCEEFFNQEAAWRENADVDSHLRGITVKTAICMLVDAEATGCTREANFWAARGKEALERAGADLSELNTFEKAHRDKSAADRLLSELNMGNFSTGRASRLIDAALRVSDNPREIGEAVKDGLDFAQQSCALCDQFHMSSQSAYNHFVGVMKDYV